MQPAAKGEGENSAKLLHSIFASKAQELLDFDQSSRVTLTVDAVDPLYAERRLLGWRPYTNKDTGGRNEELDLPDIHVIRTCPVLDCEPLKNLRVLDLNETKPDVDKGDGYGIDYRDQGDHVVTDSVGEVANARNTHKDPRWASQEILRSVLFTVSSTQII
jgi:hypothetical protein